MQRHHDKLTYLRTGKLTHCIDVMRQLFTDVPIYRHIDEAKFYSTQPLIILEEPPLLPARLKINI